MPPAPLEFGGEERFAAPPAMLYAALTDIDALAATIPDLVSSERVGADDLRCVVRPGFSFLRGTLKLSISIDRAEPPHRAAMNVAAQGIGVSLRITATLAIESDNHGSLLRWSAEVDELKGLVAALSPTLIKAAADQVIRSAWAQVRERLGEAAV